MTDRSEPGEYENPDGGREVRAPFFIATNCLLTRRKSYHAVIGPLAEPQFQSRHFWDCVEYLDAIGVTEYEIRPGAKTGREMVSRLSVKKD